MAESSVQPGDATAQPVRYAKRYFQEDVPFVHENDTKL